LYINAMLLDEWVTYFLVYGCPLEIHLPLWKEQSFNRSNHVKYSLSHYRKPIMRARANLWSGERKRQCLEKM